MFTCAGRAGTVADGVVGIARIDGTTSIRDEIMRGWPGAGADAYDNTVNPTADRKEGR